MNPTLGAGREELDADLEKAQRAEARTLAGTLSKVANVTASAASGFLPQREIQRHLGPIRDAGARRWVKAARDAEHRFSVKHSAPGRPERKGDA